MASPLPTDELTEIVRTTVESALASAEKYEHDKVADWNTAIINNLLKTLIEKTTPASQDTSKPAQPAYKYIAHSTIIQHPGTPSDGGAAGRRGMHSAVGAFWNTEKDGTLSYKWDGAEKKGMDVVVSVNWIGI
ncbi:hypothetical protein DPSP01_008920 [Paraphaeosphaeria sporulosa]